MKCEFEIGSDPINKPESILHLLTLISILDCLRYSSRLHAIITHRRGFILVLHVDAVAFIAAFRAPARTGECRSNRDFSSQMVYK
jgi:hypothetical protein